MKWTFLFSLLIGLVGCSRDSCDYYYGDLCIYSVLPVKQAEVEQVIQIIDEELEEDYSDEPALSEILAEQEVFVKFYEYTELAANCERITPDDPLIAGYDIFACEKTVDGVNVRGEWNHIEYRECLAWTALSHELLHVFEHFTLGAASMDHMTPWMFDEYAEAWDYPKLSCVEGRVKRRMVYEMPCAFEDRTP